MISYLLHRLAHLCCWQRGIVVTEWYGDQLWVGFQCATCGEVTGAHPSRQRRA